MSGWSWDHYHLTLLPLGVASLLLAWLTRPKADDSLPDGFRGFQLIFLPVWYVCAAADWLQGPYGWEVLEAYGFPPEEITNLFAVGFASSLIVSTFIGVVADVAGRKKVCILFCFANVLNCAAIHFNSWPILFVGKCISGISTPILYTIFEVWLVSEHKQRHRFSDKLLGYNFGLMFLGMYVVAIVCGLVTQALVAGTGTEQRMIGDSGLIYGYGYTLPFAMTIALMIIGAPLIAFLWPENYGTEDSEAAKGSKAKDTVLAAVRVMGQDPRILLVTLSGALFEGAMYAFVVNWTPALQSETLVPAKPPSGVVFSGFMMCCMSGAAVATLTDGRISARMRLPLVYAVATVALFVATFSIGADQPRITFAMFLLFEFSVGIYFPTLAMVRQEVVPEQVRGAVYSVHRIVMNAVTLGILFGNLTLRSSFVLCSLFLAIATVCSLAFNCVSERVSLERPEEHPAERGDLQLTPNREDKNVEPCQL